MSKDRRESENYDFPVSETIGDHLAGRKPRGTRRSIRPLGEVSVGQSQMAKALKRLKALTGFTPPVKETEAEEK